jgi:hypothetical protein
MQTTNQRFFLSDLGDHKAIFGYPWFTSIQLKINWKKGWINFTHLPIVLSALNAVKAVYVPQTKNAPRPIRKRTDTYLLGRVTIGGAMSNPEPNNAIPAEYRHHRKVFSEEESQ